MDNSNAKGLLFLVSAPSGAGKSSLVHDLITKDPNVHLSISYTTREVRPGEQDGVDYHFISQEDFEERKKNHEFLEWAFVHGNYYGTSRLWIEQELAAGYDVMLEIDWQGAFQVKRFSGCDFHLYPAAFDRSTETASRRPRHGCTGSHRASSEGGRGGDRPCPAIRLRYN